MIKKILILVLFSFLIVSCGEDEYPELRVFSDADAKLENVVLAGVDFGSIEIDSNTDYKEFDKHYDKFLITYTYKGETFSYDFGDENLMNSKYCVKITKRENSTGHMFSKENFISCSDN